MALYSIVLMPLTEILCVKFPNVLQPWYADGAAMQGLLAKVATCFTLLVKLGPMIGYLTEREKSFAIYPIATEAMAKVAFTAENLEVKACRGHHYIGGYVGSPSMWNRWVEPMVESWVEGIKALSMVACKYPQSAYHGFALLL